MQVLMLVMQWFDDLIIILILQLEQFCNIFILKSTQRIKYNWIMSHWVCVIYIFYNKRKYTVWRFAVHLILLFQKKLWPFSIIGPFPHRTIINKSYPEITAFSVLETQFVKCHTFISTRCCEWLYLISWLNIRAVPYILSKSCIGGTNMFIDNKSSWMNELFLIYIDLYHYFYYLLIS